ncbi:NAD+ synthase [Candidatus Nitrososphaera sp. FF02]|uniref:NAD+ synthase n=1 Tax=Candidatus Nitrososphaera sp. FF02 TaxID=3398226 RepID=UPI0039EAC85B
MATPRERALAKLAAFDRAKAAKRIEKFIAGYVRGASAKGVVIGLSGGLDSAAVAALCVRALGSKKVFGLVMPGRSTPKEDTDDAVAHAKELGIEYQIIDIEPIVERYTQDLPGDKIARGNLTTRVRTSILYYHAYVRKSLVAGTSDRSEMMIGYFTKFGDGAADLLPIADVYKTQLRKLGQYLKLPDAILQKKSGPRLWSGHTAEGELGMGYETIDPVLAMLVDRKKTARQAASALGIPLAHVTRVQEMMERSAHKRAMPAKPDDKRS